MGSHNHICERDAVHGSNSKDCRQQWQLDQAKSRERSEPQSPFRVNF